MKYYLKAITIPDEDKLFETLCSDYESLIFELQKLFLVCKKNIEFQIQVMED